jgi:hypothetical protein
VTGKSNLGRLQFELDPQPHDPPQQPPPAPSRGPSSAASVPPPAIAKLETSTLVRVDSHAGQTWALSLSANLVRTSNFFEQPSHRYS